ncbi:hypothetical protein RJ641_034064 [Dillenia turbinata]|uniref:Uncharacterized protein n=1 Tax=Dillenia turbinata TaxID=194707 RepID=A0AAN8ZDW6_9MAGN
MLSQMRNSNASRKVKNEEEGEDDGKKKNKKKTLREEERRTKMCNEKISKKIPHFDGLRYDNWSELMENLLHAKGLRSLVEKGFEEPCEGTTLTETKLEQLETARTNDHKRDGATSSYDGVAMLVLLLSSLDMRT